MGNALSLALDQGLKVEVLDESHIKSFQLDTMETQSIHVTTSILFLSAECASSKNYFPNICNLFKRGVFNLFLIKLISVLTFL